MNTYFHAYLGEKKKYVVVVQKISRRLDVGFYRAIKVWQLGIAVCYIRDPKISVVS